MFEFGVVLTGVAAVMVTSWSRVSRWRLGVGGFLSFALGTRVVALATASYLSPLLMDQARAEDGPTALTAESATAQPLTAESFDPVATSAAASKDLSSPPTAKKAPVENTLTAEFDGPSPLQSVKQMANKLDERQPIRFATDVKYLTPNRPAWLEMAPSYEGDMLKMAVRAGPYQTIRRCEPDLEREVTAAVAEFINDHLQTPTASRLIHYSLKDLRKRKVVREQFSEQLETSSVGLMSQVHALLVFDQDFRDELDERWGALKAKSRLAQTGLGVGVVLILLGTLFSFLKLDTATKGYYTGRLQFGAATMILLLVAASVLLTKYIRGM